MRIGLDLRTTQQLHLTPQLQQAIRLLQLSRQELEQEIQSTLESNPCLEVVESEAPLVDARLQAEFQSLAPAPSSPPSADKESMALPSDGVGGSDQTTDGLERLDAPSLESTVVEWDVHWDSPVAEGSWGPVSAGDPESRMELNEHRDLSLREHLNFQLELLGFEGAEYELAALLIDSIDEDGYLRMDLKEAALWASVSEAVALRVLERIQTLDPAGVAARNLLECLLLQLRGLKETPSVLLANRLIEEQGDALLGWLQKKPPRLAAALGVTVDALEAAWSHIRQLNPRPGSRFFKPDATAIIPDLVLMKRNGKWRLELNLERFPKLRVSQNYAQMMRSVHSEKDHQYLKDHLAEARWFLKSIKNRHEMLLKVAGFLIEYQMEFLEKGEAFMKPLILQDVAARLSVHESTISRVTAQKYVMTPRGLFDLKYFFSNYMPLEDGTSCSAAAIRASIKQLIENESSERPLSDQTIANSLRRQGMPVARRTIAKYRESLRIPTSHSRRQAATASVASIIRH